MKTSWPRLFKQAREKRRARKAEKRTAPAITEKNKWFVWATLKHAGFEDPWQAPERAIHYAVQHVSRRSVLIIPKEMRKLFTETDQTTNST